MIHFLMRSGARLDAPRSPAEAMATPSAPAAFRLVLFAALFAAAPGNAVESVPSPVSVAQPKRGDITRFIALPGTLRANQQVVVQARVAGFIASIPVDRGDQVRSGQVLALIEAPELLADRARLAAELKVAEAEAARLESARARSPDLVIPQALDAAVGRRDVARASLEKSDTLLGYTQVKAPFAGTISARFVDPGAFVPAGAAGGGSALVTLVDARVVRAQVPVPEAEAIHVQVGQPVRLSVEGRSHETLETVVARHSGVVDEATRTLLVEADLPNAAGALRPGMFATVRIGVERHTNAVLIPTEAIAVEKNATYVFRVDQGLCRKTPVQIGFQDGPVTELISGLGPEPSGTRVIVPARTAPADGATVRTKETP